MLKNVVQTWYWRWNSFICQLYKQSTDNSITGFLSISGARHVSVKESQITGTGTDCLIACSSDQQRNHQKSALQTFARGIHRRLVLLHYDDVIMTTMASQITSLTIVYSTVYSGTDQRKHQSSASLAFVQGIHRGPVNSPHKWPVRGKCFHLMT